MDTTGTNTLEADVSRASELYGQTQGAMVLIGAGFGWVMIGLSALGEVPLTLFLAVLAVAALLLLGGLAVRRSAPDLDMPWTPQMKRVFGQAVAGEIAGSLIVVIVALLTRHTQWIQPLVALAVGLHFFPIAHAFRRPLYFVTGAALCLVCVITIALVPPHFGAHHMPGWQLVTGLGSGAVLWSTSLWMLIQSVVGLRTFSQSRRLAR